MAALAASLGTHDPLGPRLCRQWHAALAAGASAEPKPTVVWAPSGNASVIGTATDPFDDAAVALVATGIVTADGLPFGGGSPVRDLEAVDRHRASYGSSAARRRVIALKGQISLRVQGVPFRLGH